MNRFHPESTFWSHFPVITEYVFIYYGIVLLPLLVLLSTSFLLPELRRHGYSFRRLAPAAIVMSLVLEPAVYIFLGRALDPILSGTEPVAHPFSFAPGDASILIMSYLVVGCPSWLFGVARLVAIPVWLRGSRKKAELRSLLTIMLGLIVQGAWLTYLAFLPASFS